MTRKRTAYDGSDKQKEYMRKYNKEYRQRDKRTMVDAYGGQCVCCGEKELVFLTADHIGGDGASHRRSVGLERGSMLRWLKENNYPPGFQILCWNCNAAKHLVGICPHQLSTRQTLW
jgi:hypothetical protein